MHFLLFFLGTFVCSVTFAQRIDSYSTLFEIPESAFFRIQYDNDLFQGQDVYYSQGIRLEIINPVFRKNPINKILISLPNSSSRKYGISAEIAAFTPTSILSDSILYNDRPYAAIMALNFLQMSYSDELKLKLSSNLQVGLIGQAALGKEIQTGIHRVTNNSLPLGWQHQIQNDLILNYAARLDKQFLSYRSLIAVIGIGEVNLGTYQTNISVGLDMSFGHKNNAFEGKQNKVQYYIYGQSKLKAVGYDASLMGGLFNRTSDYTVPYSQINKLVAEQHVGIVFQFPHVYFGTDFGFITPEFSGGNSHAWGGIRLGFY